MYQTKYARYKDINHISSQTLRSLTNYVKFIVCDLSVPRSLTREVFKEYISGSWKWPNHSVRFSFLLQANTITINSIRGSLISPNGSVWTVDISISIQAILPAYWEAQPINRQSQVLLETSNLRRQEITKPGCITVKTGSQAHFLNSSGVIDGNWRSKGLLKSFMMRLLYDTFRTQWMMSPPIVSRSTTENKKMVPIFKESILKSLIDPKMMHRAIISLAIQLDPVDQYTIKTMMEVNIDTISNTLIFLQTNMLLILVFRTQISSFVVTYTPIAPSMEPLIFKEIEKKDKLRYMSTEHPTMIRLRNNIRGYVTFTQNPLKEDARLQIEAIVIISRESKIIKSNPHSKGLYTIEGLQFTMQLKLQTPLISTVNLLIAYLLFGQLFVILRRQFSSQMEGETVPKKSEYLEDIFTVDSEGRLVMDIMQCEYSAVDSSQTQSGSIEHEQVDLYRNQGCRLPLTITGMFCIVFEFSLGMIKVMFCEIVVAVSIARSQKVNIIIMTISALISIIKQSSNSILFTSQSNSCTQIFYL